MANWYKHDIAAWMDGTEQLDDASYRVYHVTVQLIYLNEGPIRLNEAGIAGRCKMHILKFRKVIAGLVHLGLLQFEDGKLFNVRAKSELQRLPTRRLPTPNRPPPPARPPPNLGSTSGQQGGGSVRGLPDKPLESQDVATQPDLLDKTRLDKTRPERKEGPVGPVDLEKQFYDRAVEVIDASPKEARTIAGSLLKAHGKNIAQARSALEQAAGRSSAKQFLWGHIQHQKKKSAAPIDDTVMMNNADDSRVLM
jgi:hypothetical protein